MDPQRKDYLATEAVYTGDSLRIGDEYVMHEWERPLICKMVEDLQLTPNDRLLEIGFGMGISATILQEFDRLPIPLSNPTHRCCSRPSAGRAHAQIFSYTVATGSSSALGSSAIRQSFSIRSQMTWRRLMTKTSDSSSLLRSRYSVTVDAWPYFASGPCCRWSIRA